VPKVCAPEAEKLADAEQEIPDQEVRLEPRNSGPPVASLAALNDSHRAGRGMVRTRAPVGSHSFVLGHPETSEFYFYFSIAMVYHPPVLSWQIGLFFNNLN
jgi:hypothetical protein